MAFNHKTKRRRAGYAIVVLTVIGALYSTVSVGEECATEFFSQKTCRLFDNTILDTEARHHSTTSAESFFFLKDDSGLLGSQIWYRNQPDGNWMLMMPFGQKAPGNLAIHGQRCIVDLFGTVVCDQNQSNVEILPNEKLNN